MRGDVHRVRAPRESPGHAQTGARYAVVVQPDDLPLSTWLVAPTSTSARAATFRPEIDPSRLGELVGHLRFDKLRQVEAALRLVTDL